VCAKRFVHLTRQLSLPTAALALDHPNAGQIHKSQSVVRDARDVVSLEVVIQETLVVENAATV
jgi:hypothetical protein